MAREYKDSGIEWIGQIPKEWKVLPHKYIMRKKKEIQEHYSGQDIISLSMNGVIVRDLDAGGKMPLSFDGYQVVYPNNLLLCLFDIDVTPRCVGLIKNFGVTSPAYSQFVVKEDGYPPYYDYLLRYMDDNKCLLHLSKNLRSSLTETDFGYIHTCLPPLSEQQKIADYLDKVCGEVDEMITLQEQMIDELKAYKQSVITEAVTKGLNPNVLMKDSGIDWIGEIPESWKVVKLSLLTSKIGSGSTPTGGANVYVSEGVKFLRSQNVYFEGLDLSDVAHITEKIDEEMKGTRVLPGDVLLNITGGSIGRCYFVDETLGKANVNQHVSIIRPNNIDTKYLKYSLQSTLGQHQVSLLQTGGNREGLSAAALSNFKILLPSKDEQQSIATYLDRKCAEIDDLIAIKQSKIEELKEYKKSVIYEYVTGKKEVV